MHRATVTVLALCASTLVVSQSLLAQPIVGRATGLASPAQVVDFNLLPLRTQPTLVQGVDFGGLWTVGNRSTMGGGVFLTSALYNYRGFQYGPPLNPIGFRLGGSTNAVAFNVYTTVSSTVFYALLGGNIVSTFRTSTDNTFSPQKWYGFENITFDEVVVDATQSITGFMGIDNLQVGPITQTVPEPSTGAMLAAALAFGGAVLRRRRRADASDRA